MHLKDEAIIASPPKGILYCEKLKQWKVLASNNEKAFQKSEINVNKVRWKKKVKHAEHLHFYHEYSEERMTRLKCNSLRVGITFMYLQHTRAL